MSRACVWVFPGEQLNSNINNLNGLALGQGFTSWVNLNGLTLIEWGFCGSDTELTRSGCGLQLVDLLYFENRSDSGWASTHRCPLSTHFNQIGPICHP